MSTEIEAGRTECAIVQMWRYALAGYADAAMSGRPDERKRWDAVMEALEAFPEMKAERARIERSAHERPKPGRLTV